MWRRPVATILILALPLILTLPVQAQQKAFTQEQVSNMVRAGLGDDSGAKLIEQRGIDFAPSEDFYQTLKAAGASETFLDALRAAVAPGLSPAHADVAASLPRHGGVKPPLRDAALKGGSTTAGPPDSAKKPLNQMQVFAALAGQVPSHRVTMLVQERGLDFEPTDGGRRSPFSVCSSPRLLKIAFSCRTLPVLIWHAEV